MALFLERMSGSIFHDARPEDVLPFYYKIMDYQEAPYAVLPPRRSDRRICGRTQTKRIMAASQGKLAVYPGSRWASRTRPTSGRFLRMTSGRRSRRH